MIDSNGKLFGKISVVDLVVLLIIVVAAAGLYIRFFGGSIGAEKGSFQYTVRVEGIRQPSVDALNDSVGTAFALDGNQTSDMGVLQDVSFTPSQKPVHKTDGTIVLAQVPEKFDGLLTFEISGNISDKGYYSPQNVQIYNGAMLSMKGRYSAFECTVIHVE